MRLDHLLSMENGKVKSFSNSEVKFKRELSELLFNFEDAERHLEKSTKRKPEPQKKGCLMHHLNWGCMLTS